MKKSYANRWCALYYKKICYFQRKIFWEQGWGSLQKNVLIYNRIKEQKSYVA